VLIAADGKDVQVTKGFLEDIDDPRLVILSAKRVSSGTYGYDFMDRIDDVWKVAEQVASVQRRIRIGDSARWRIPDESIFDVDWTGYYRSLDDEFDCRMETASDDTDQKMEKYFGVQRCTHFINGCTV